MPDDLPRIRYKKAVLPLPADQPFQQAVAARDITKAAVQRVRAFLGSPHISLAVAIENAGIHDIQLTVIGKPPGIAGVRLPPGALLAQPLPMAVRLTLGYVEMPHLLRVGAVLHRPVDEQGHAIVHPGNDQSARRPYLIPGAAAEAHGHQNRVDVPWQPFHGLHDLTLHLSWVIGVPVMQNENGIIRPQSPLCRLNILCHGFARQYPCPHMASPQDQQILLTEYAGQRIDVQGRRCPGMYL